jgi:oxygen-independent coproporphyrinogen III oxidase
MHMQAGKTTWAGGPATTVYFGGGTPSLHSPAEIATIIEKIDNLWKIDAGAEITLEANPGHLDPDWLIGWKTAGINRLSLGIQSFSARKLKQLYRDHSPEDARHSFQAARQAGFANLSLDLIFGLPGETMEEWRCDVETALALAPEHISLYNLEYHEGTPFFRWGASGRLMPLAEDFEADLYLATHEWLTVAGYEHYEISNFARPNFRSVHNSAYWQGKPYLGLGPSAHSFDGANLRCHNLSNLHEYESAIAAGTLPLAETVHLSARERSEEWIMLHLRRVEGMSFSDACTVLGASVAQRLWQRAEQLPFGLCNISQSRLGLTPSGWFREDSIYLHLFEAHSAF